MKSLFYFGVIMILSAACNSILKNETTEEGLYKIIKDEIHGICYNSEVYIVHP